MPLLHLVCQLILGGLYKQIQVIDELTGFIGDFYRLSKNRKESKGYNKNSRKISAKVPIIKSRFH